MCIRDRAYWDDGAQVLAPHDKGIIDEVNKISSATDIKFEGNKDLIQIVGEEVDSVYLNKVKTISIDPEAVSYTHLLIAYGSVALVNAKVEVHGTAPGIFATQ